MHSHSQVDNAHNPGSSNGYVHLSGEVYH